MSKDEEIVSAEACEIVGNDRRTLMRYIAQGRLKPTRKLPGRTGPYLFRRGDVDDLAAELVAAESQPTLETAVSS